MSSRGTVKWFSDKKGYGFIEREEGPDVFVHHSDVEPESKPLTGGDEVEFDVIDATEGPKARDVRRIGTASQENFVNPYNFVRWLPERPPTGDGGAVPLLDRAAPPPHDRYVALTGTVRCILTVVTDTFVPDSEDVTGEGPDEDRHRTYQFYRDGTGHPAIPGSSLRGPIRALFEAATNSCFAKANLDQRPGEKRDRGSRKVRDLLPEHLHPCHDPEKLCPACRVFGWVGPEPEGASRDGKRKKDAGDAGPSGYRSRVRIQAARFREEDLATSDPPRILPVLGAPKPSYVWFYVMNEDGAPHDPGADADAAGYRDGNALRGRKSYWFQDPSEVTDVKGDEGTRLNRSIREWLNPGSNAEFEIHFRNLAPVELGALLWSLELEGAEVHRVGFAKPYGFGAVHVRVDDIRVVAADRYTAREGEEGFRPLDGEEHRSFVQLFKAQLVRRYGESRDEEGDELERFKTLRNIADLLELLSSAQLNYSIQYPPGAQGFEWFQGNEKGAKLPLPTATADDPSLPVDPS